MKSDRSSIRLGGGQKTGVRAQFAALPFRVSQGKVQICLVTSRGRGRWILPKGWPMDGRSPWAAAEREAFEEAGVKGKAYETPLGLYFYEKQHAKAEYPCLAMVYPLKVKETLSKWPESKERRRRWFSRKKAAQKVDEFELKRMILDFDPARL